MNSYYIQSFLLFLALIPQIWAQLKKRLEQQKVG